MVLSGQLIWQLLPNICKNSEVVAAAGALPIVIGPAHWSGGILRGWNGRRAHWTLRVFPPHWFHPATKHGGGPYLTTCLPLFATFCNEMYTFRINFVPILEEVLAALPTTPCWSGVESHLFIGEYRKRRETSYVNVEVQRRHSQMTTGCPVTANQWKTGRHFSVPHSSCSSSWLFPRTPQKVVRTKREEDELKAGKCQGPWVCVMLQFL